MSRSSSPGRTPLADRRHVAEHQVHQRVDRLQREGLEVLRLVHPQGRDLELDEVVEARLHVDPVVEVGEPGRRRRHDERVADVLDRGAAQPRLLAVDLDLDGGVIELLLELDVAEEGDPPHLAGDLLRVLPDHLEVGPDDADGDRHRRAEAHDVGHDVARLEAVDAQLRLLAPPRRCDSPPAPAASPSRGSPARGGPCGAARGTGRA